MTESDFLTFYPQFTVIPEAVLSAYVESAGLRFDEFGEDAEEARRLYTAHRLTLYARAVPSSSGAQGGVPSFSALAFSGDSARVTSKKVDDVAITYASGNSGGGTATFYASCMDPRIRVSVPSCAVCTYEASIMAMHHCACNYIPHIRRFFEMGDLGCLIAPRRLVMVSGKNDNIFPIDGAKASFDLIETAFAAAGKQDHCVHIIGGAGHQFYPDEAWPVIHKLLNMEE